MARIRTIKPEFPQSESMGRVSRDARLCFVLLWTICDDYGRTRANSRMLASLLFPYDGDAGNAISGWLDELEEEKCISRYEVDGNSYLEVLHWSSHQKVDHPGKHQFPEPPSSRKSSRGKARTREKIANNVETLALDQGPRTKDQGPIGFEEFWKAYPRRVARPKAEESYSKALGKATPDELLKGARRYAAQRLNEDPKFTAHPTTWLNQGRWADEDGASDPSSGNGLDPELERVQRLEEEARKRRMESGDAVH